MKQLFTTILLLLTITAFSQTYNNEWIDFTKTYYKFKVGRTGLYRIPQATLNAAGLGNVPAEQFKLFRNGQEVPIYTSVATGFLGANDYIEFWGQKNDGVPDKALYRNPAYQHSTAISLQSDTAVFFLTANTSANLRISDQANNVTSSSQPAESYFMYTTGDHFTSQINPGYAQLAGDYIYSSSYDIGEFWSSANIAPGGPLSDQVSNLFVYTAGPNASIKFGAVGCAPNNRSLNLKINNTSLKDTAFSGFSDVLPAAIYFSPSLLSSGAATVAFTNNSTVVTDRMVISYYDITYPRLFNFGAATNFPFVLSATSNDYSLAITNFNKGAALPVLYDLTNNARYTAVLGGGDTVKFLLPGPSQQRNLVLVSEDASNINSVTALTSKTFVNFSNSANQGNYLIISNPILYNDGTNDGVNPVNDYKTYRSSATGGSYNVTVVDINELVDQFAFGIKKDPISIKNFIQFARDKYTAAPRFVLLIGRGVDYVNYRANQNNPLADVINLVPTFGYPASDNMLSSLGPASAVPVTPIGRLSVINGAELEAYLTKMKEYELAQQTAANTIESRAWMKNVMEVTGASELSLGQTLCDFMSGYQAVLADTLSGANVSIFCDNSANSVQQVTSDQVTNLIDQGLSMMLYFGHSSSTVLEFNIDDPQTYTNQGKYPIFSVNGCNAGQFFTFDTQRPNGPETLSETFTLAKERGCIAFLASTNYSLVNYLSIYINSLCANASNYLYGHTLGEIFNAAINQLIVVNSSTDFFARSQAEQMEIHGDPALKMNFESKPDYVIEDAQVKINPAFISVAQNQFTATINIYNLGKAVTDSIRLTVTRQYPDGSKATIYSQKMRGTFYEDSVTINVPIVATRDKGDNKLTVTIDADNAVDEVDESNNTITKDVYIYQDEARPSFPYNYGIVNNPSQHLYASTADPFAPAKDYTVQIDTTALFNSPLLRSKVINIAGGIIDYTPSISFVNNTVYYWRVGVLESNGQMDWNVASFLFLSTGTDGFNQSHFYQFNNNTYNNLNYQDPGRIFTFGTRQVGFSVGTAIYPYVSQTSNFALNVSGQAVQAGVYSPLSADQNCLRFYVIDGKTLKPWVDVVSGTTGLYGSYAPVPINGTVLPGFFHFDISTTAARKTAMNFLDLIPAGNYVIMTNTPVSPTIYPSVWEGDTATMGSGVSLYNKLKNLGFSLIDSLNNNFVPFVFIYQKGANGIVTQQIAQYASATMNVNFTATGPASSGQMTSDLFGPVKKWTDLTIQGKTLPASTDSVNVQVIGVKADGITTSPSPLLTVNPPFNVTSLASIDPTQYPYVRLQLNTTDTVTYTPYQLSSWKVTGNYVPEGSLAPNLYFTTQDTLDVGQPLNFGIAFKNISHTAFDSVQVAMTVTDKNNTAHVITLPKQKALAANDTIALNYQLDTRAYAGANTLYLDFNPNNAQPEQYTYNNFLYRNFYVRPDSTNPLLDITFDGVHILNGDIVSSKPHIQIKLKDESKYMLLTDTSIISQLQVRYPDANGTVRTFKFDNDTLRFTPATSGANNTATVDFTPYFPTIVDNTGQPLNPGGDTYTLMVKGKDESGNNAGLQEYDVNFTVIDKPMISNLLNYPNPFTTSTAFVFTITGSEIPQDMKIQIMTITGKIVREITRQELGSIHIGQNITDYKWNGTDQYGQRLGNGVYLYRVITQLNGKNMQKYTAEGDNTDQYFNHGYGKMYLMGK